MDVSRLERIEKSISNLLPENVDESWLESVAGRFHPEAPLQGIDSFIKPALDILSRGGKRWRPMVTLLTCESLGGGRAGDILAPFTEIPHNGSLIIDDIEDNSLTRRGLDAIHIVHGDDLAINAGNLMYFLPSVLLEREDFRHLGERTCRDITHDWLRVMRRLHLGQGYDILWHREKNIYPSQSAYLCMCRFKTGSLSGLAATLGARAAQSVRTGNPEYIGEDIVQKISIIWENMGTGFQILDDVQNLSSGIPGKDRGDDIVEGKKSLPVILHAESRPEDIPRLAELFSIAAKQAPLGDWSTVEQTIELLNSSGSITAAREAGKNMLNNGITEITELLPENEARQLMLNLIERFINKMV